MILVLLEEGIAHVAVRISRGLREGGLEVGTGEILL